MKQIDFTLTAFISRFWSLQRYCRGYLVRQWASKRMTSIVRLQACIRTMIARKKYRRQKIEVRTLAVHFSVKLMSVTHGKIALQFEKIQKLIKLCTYRTYFYYIHHYHLVLWNLKYLYFCVLFFVYFVGISHPWISIRNE